MSSVYVGTNIRIDAKGERVERIDQGSKIEKKDQ
jgi:hypothetical protein